MLRGKEKDFWVEGVVGVRCDIRHGQGLIGYFCFVGGDGAGKAGHDLIVRIKSKQSGFRNRDDDPRDWGKFASAFEVGQGELGSDNEVCHAGVKLFQKGWCGVCFFRQHFPWVIEIQGGKLTHSNEAFRLGNHMKKILGRDRVVHISISWFS